MMDASPTAGQCAPSGRDRIRECARRFAQQAPALTAEQRTRLATLLHMPAPIRTEVAGGVA